MKTKIIFAVIALCTIFTASTSFAQEQEIVGKKELLMKTQWKLPINDDSKHMSFQMSFDNGYQITTVVMGDQHYVDKYEYYLSNHADSVFVKSNVGKSNDGNYLIVNKIWGNNNEVIASRILKLTPDELVLKNTSKKVVIGSKISRLVADH